MVRHSFYPDVLALLLIMRGIAASQTAQQMAHMNPGATANIFGPGQDSDKLFQNEAENLEVLEHKWILDGVEDRLLRRIS